MASFQVHREGAQGGLCTSIPTQQACLWLYSASEPRHAPELPRGSRLTGAKMASAALPGYPVPDLLAGEGWRPCTFSALSCFLLFPIACWCWAGLTCSPPELWPQGRSASLEMTSHIYKLSTAHVQSGATLESSLLTLRTPTGSPCGESQGWWEEAELLLLNWSLSKRVKQLSPLRDPH